MLAQSVFYVIMIGKLLGGPGPTGSDICYGPAYNTKVDFGAAKDHG